jgi:predicted kinase
MRKWINERLKRRKKSVDKPAKEAIAAPEPLQPRFYDNDPNDNNPNDSEPKVVASAPADAEVVESTGTSVPSAGDAPQVQAALESNAKTGARSPEGPSVPRLPRRRRSRGRRGGSRQRPVAAAAKSSVEKSSLPGESSATQSAATLEDSSSRSSARSSTLRSSIRGAVTAPLLPGPANEAQALALQSPPAHPGPAQAVPTARPSKGTVVLAIGLPGSGKSSWFKRHSIHPLSSDLLRELLFDDAQEQRFQDLVFSNLRSMLKARLIARRPMNYVDATNLTPHDRHSWIKLAKDYGYDVQGLFFDVPLEVCMERHQRRGRVVPEDVMRKMAGKLKAPTFEEGFSKITVVRVKQKEEATPPVEVNSPP